MTIENHMNLILIIVAISMLFVLVNCPAGCLTCDATTGCTSCITDYLLQEDQCVRKLAAFQQRLSTLICTNVAGHSG